MTAIKDFIETAKDERAFGWYRPRRIMPLALNIMVVSIILGAVVTGKAVFIMSWVLLPFNVFIVLFYGWMLWPWLTGNTANQRAKDNDNIRNT